MDRKSMAGKTLRTCTVGRILKKKDYNFFKFKIEITLNGYFDKFLS